MSKKQDRALKKIFSEIAKWPVERKSSWRNLYWKIYGDERSSLVNAQLKAYKKMEGE